LKRPGPTAARGRKQHALAALRIDHIERGNVVDLVVVTADQRLLVDPVRLPHTLKLWRAAGRELPAPGHPVELGVIEHVVDLGRFPVGVDAQQLKLIARLPKVGLGIDHCLRGQRADRLALGVDEREDHRFAPVLTEAHALPGLADEREVRCPAHTQRGARIEVGVCRKRGPDGSRGACAARVIEQQRHDHDQEQRRRQQRHRPHPDALQLAAQPQHARQAPQLSEAPHAPSHVQQRQSDENRQEPAGGRVVVVGRSGLLAA
jgi:hypothetical protein